MGCWSETCLVTGAPIDYGEECVMVVLDEERLNLIRDPIMGMIGFQGSCLQYAIVKSIHRGVYNDYGWIDGVEEVKAKEGYSLPPAIFAHKEAWQWLIDYNPKPMFIEFAFEGAERYELKVTDDLKEFAIICKNASDIRRDIFSGLTMCGSQNNITDKNRAKFIMLQWSIFKKQRRRFSEYQDFLEEGKE